MSARPAVGRQEEEQMVTIYDIVAAVRGQSDMPPGCRVIGQGQSRVAVLGPDGRVYKVPCESVVERSGARDNRREARLFAEMAGKSFCPGAVQLLTVVDEYGDDVPVLRMEYIEADGSEASNLSEMLEWLAERRLLDLNSANWIVRGGRAIVVDAACV
jgi:hypothetical protein